MVALSNGVQYSIRIPMREKRIALDYLKQRSGGTRKLSQLRLFTVALYYLLQQLPSNELVTIDTEYEGHEPALRSMLLNLIWQDEPGFDSERIVFGRIGKKSNAHKLALEVYRKRKPADRILKADDLLKKIIGP